MRILIVGSDYVWSIERLYKKYLGEAGAAWVGLFAAQNLFYAYYQQSLLNKFLFRSGLSAIQKRINDLLIAEIDAVKPDIVWVFKGMEILPSTLEACRKKGICLVNFNGDNPFIFSGAGSGNKNVFRSLPLFDLHLTYNLEVKARLENEYKVETGFLPFGFDVSEEVYENCCREKEINKVCFLGNADPTRKDFIRRLAGSGTEIDIYGGKEWSELAACRGITIFPPVYEEGFWKIIRRYRVQLNLMRPHNMDSHNMRSFEVPGIGGIMLAPATTEHRMFFTDGKEAFLFTDEKDCLEKGRLILSLRKEEADSIRGQARRRSLDDGYTYKKRAKSALEQMERIYAKTGSHSF